MKGGDFIQLEDVRYARLFLLFQTHLACRHRPSEQPVVHQSLPHNLYVHVVRLECIQGTISGSDCATSVRYQSLDPGGLAGALNHRC